MTAQNDPPDQARPARFEATVHRGGGDAPDLARVADMDLDRVADPDGGLRLLLDLDECARLVDAGFEVRLHRSLAVQPLDPGLITDDESVRAWFDERTRWVRPEPGEES